MKNSKLDMTEAGTCNPSTEEADREAHWSTQSRRIGELQLRGGGYCLKKWRVTGGTSVSGPPPLIHEHPHTGIRTCVCKIAIGAADP